MLLTLSNNSKNDYTQLKQSFLLIQYAEKWTCTQNEQHANVWEVTNKYLGEHNKIDFVLQKYKEEMVEVGL